LSTVSHRCRMWEHSGAEEEEEEEEEVVEEGALGPAVLKRGMQH